VPGVGVLLATPALLDSGVFLIAREIYGSLGPAFYGLRTTLVTLLLMARLRVKRPEGLKERSPGKLGQVLGLERAPEGKTLRSKLARLAAQGCSAQFGRALARRRVTVVFYRGGWSPKLFARILADGFDLLTYRNATATRFPGTRLRMRFTLKTEPPKSPAFPGPRNHSDPLQPDILQRG